MDIKGFFAGWKFDAKTALFTLVVSPLILFLLAILKRYLKLWGSYALEGAMYWLFPSNCHVWWAAFDGDRL